MPTTPELRRITTVSAPSASIQGIFVPNIVPYDELHRNGSMGEFIRLGHEERKRVLRIIVGEAGGKPILAGAAEPNMDLVLEMCVYCEDRRPHHRPAA